MNILYAIQGTGNGHLSRARDLVPRLQAYGKVDILVSGTQSDIQLDHPIRYRCRGLSFVYNRRGGIHYLKSGRHTFSTRLIREIATLPVKQYDLVLNDFEPVSAWAARMRGVPCVSIGHQASFLSALSPRPARQDFFGEVVLKHYAPATQAVGFHFQSYDSFIFPPVIRNDIRSKEPQNNGYFTVYLPAFNEHSLLHLLQQIPSVKWQVFSRYARKMYTLRNIQIHPVDAVGFTNSLLNCTGVLTSAGFETPAEALYLGKKLMTVPIKGQYEQYCNAAALQQMGVHVVHKIEADFIERLRQWIKSETPKRILFPDMTAQAIQTAFGKHLDKKEESAPILPKHRPTSSSKRSFINLNKRKDKQVDFS